MAQYSQPSSSTQHDRPSRLWTPSLKIPLPSFTSKSVIIAVMGMTGAGKTSFIKMITGLDGMEVGHGLRSCTKQVEVATTHIDGFQVHFIDTPGFDDDELQEGDVLENIATYLKTGVQLSGILYLHSLSNGRMGGVGKRNLVLLQTLVGSKNMRNVKLITTKSSEVTQEQSKARHQDLIRYFWDGMLLNGAQHELYDGTYQNGMRIVRSVLRTAPVTILLQEELANGCLLSDTSAGRSLVEAYIELQEQYNQKAKECEDNAAEHKEALRKRDEAAEQVQKIHDAKITEMQGRIKDLEDRWCVLM